jgi:hypothetical protein
MRVGVHILDFHAKVSNVLERFLDTIDPSRKARKTKLAAIKKRRKLERARVAAVQIQRKFERAKAGAVEKLVKFERTRRCVSDCDRTSR